METDKIDKEMDRINGILELDIISTAISEHQINIFGQAQNAYAT